MAWDQKNYVMAGGSGEIDWLQLQARVWEPDADVLLDQIGIQPGGYCLDLGCGAMGILGPLSRRVGARGRVVGVDQDVKLLGAAQALVAAEGWGNVELVQGDAYHTPLARMAFDVVHVRFVLAPGGQADALIDEMYALTRPGGVMAVQETVVSSWTCFPAHPAWERLQEALFAAFARGGGDANAGLKTYGLWRQAGLKDVRMRAAVVALPPGHPYLRLPMLFATPLRHHIVDGGFLTAAELDETIVECERIAQAPETIGLSFVVVQVWGRKS